MPYSVDGASLVLGLMIAAYDLDEAAWKSLVHGMHGIVIADALRFMMDTYTTRAGEDAKQRLINESTANPLRAAADAAVAVFSAEVMTNGDTPGKSCRMPHCELRNSSAPTPSNEYPLVGDVW